MAKGYWGKVLRVNLTTMSIISEGLPPEEVLRSYLGCLGLGLRILYGELPSGYSATDPETPLIFFTAPLTGTQIPCSNNTTLVTKHPDTNFTLLRSHTHGWFGPSIRFAGFDGLIVTGRSEKPVYLWINSDKVEIRDAEKIWGKDTHETEDLVKKEVGQPKASVAAIGPAGENMCAGAIIENDKNHLMSHGGAVMGSKNLKAIAVYGKKKVPIFDDKKHREVAKRWIEVMKQTPTTPYHTVGRGRVCKGDYMRVKEVIGICAYNQTTTELPAFGVGLSESKITPRPCYLCPIACSYDAKIVSGTHKGYVASLTGGGEAMEGSSAMVGVVEPGDILYLTDLYDRLGIDGSTAGCTISMAFEAYEKGYITKEDTDGLELKWGDAQVVEKLVRKYCHREGFGDVLARGPKLAAEYIGRDAPDFAVHIKGTGMNLHDWRPAWGVLLGQIVSSGAGWHSAAADCWRPNPEAGYPEKTNGLTHRGKAEEVARGAIVKCLEDSIGVCWFASWGYPGIFDLISDAFSAVTGWNLTAEELWQVGERIITLQQAFNVRQGLKPEDDYNVSARVTEAPPDGPAKGISIKPYLKGMIDEYYRCLGWDEKTGKPLRNTLKRLGLKDIIKDMWG